MSATEDTNATRRGSKCNALLGQAYDARKPCTCDGAGRGPGRACVVKAGQRLGELWRCAEGHEPPEWLHLKRYGYAPGNYQNTCQRCGEVARDVDKRARCCRACAEARHAWEQPPCQQCGATSGEEAATKCLGAAAGDDCHGNHLWPV